MWRVYSKIKRKNINLDLSTIYRTLEVFENKDLIEKFDLGNSKYNFRFKRKSILTLYSVKYVIKRCR